MLRHIRVTMIVPRVKNKDTSLRSDYGRLSRGIPTRSQLYQSLYAVHVSEHHRDDAEIHAYN